MTKGAKREAECGNGSIGHGVVAATTPRVATEQATNREPRAAQSTVTAQGLQRILAAGGRETARRGRVRGDAVAIKQDGEREHPCHRPAEPTGA